jgi:hypothetical protein
LFDDYWFIPCVPPAFRFIVGPSVRRAPAALVSDRPEVLEELPSAPAAIAVWRRRLPLAVAAGLEAWARSHASPHDAEVVVTDCDLAAWLRGLDDAEARAWLERDVRGLVERFARALDVREVRLVLGPVTDDKCRKFHVDNLRMRMLCTYVGPGTEWVDDPSAADRPQRASAGDVVWIRGKAWPGGARGGVHRSPPLAGSGQVRLVLVVSTLAP